MNQDFNVKKSNICLKKKIPAQAVSEKKKKNSCKLKIPQKGKRASDHRRRLIFSVIKQNISTRMCLMYDFKNSLTLFLLDLVISFQQTFSCKSIKILKVLLSK